MIGLVYGLALLGAVTLAAALLLGIGSAVGALRVHGEVHTSSPKCPHCGRDL